MLTLICCLLLTYLDNLTDASSYCTLLYIRNRDESYFLFPYPYNLKSGVGREERIAGSLSREKSIVTGRLSIFLSIYQSSVFPLPPKGEEKRRKEKISYRCNSLYKQVYIIPVQLEINSVLISSSKQDKKDQSIFQSMEWLNTTASAGTVLTDSQASFLPPLPSYTLTPRERIYSGLPDGITILIPPLVVYWVVSLFFHFLDVYNLFPQYRLHTPLEVLQRNHVSRADVVRDVLLQQVVQTIAGACLVYFDDVEYTGKDGYNVAVWALRLRKLTGYVPSVFKLVGIDAVQLAGKVSASAPTLAGILLGGKYPDLTQTIVDVKTGAEVLAPAFAGWELKLAEILYYYGFPALQFFVAICIVDSWQYFLHRAMHMNKWLYSECLPPFSCASRSKFQF